MRRRGVGSAGSTRCGTSSTPSFPGRDPVRRSSSSHREPEDLVAADLATVVIPDPDGNELVIQVADGDQAEALTGRGFPAEGSISGAVVRSGQPEVTREALSNVGRHTRATTCRVSLYRRGEYAVMEVDDDGVGFDPKTVRRGDGLRNLEQRSAALAARRRSIPFPAKARPCGSSCRSSFQRRSDVVELQDISEPTLDAARERMAPMRSSRRG